MNIFYLNCARRVSKSRILTDKGKVLVDFIKNSDIDFIFLSESSNYDFNNDLGGLYKFFKVDKKLALGYGYNIIAKNDFDIEFVSFEEERKNAKYRHDLHDDRIALIKYNDIIFISVHIPHEPKLRVIALNKLFNVTKEKEPLIIFGDFNCGYNKDSFNYRENPVGKKEPFKKEEPIFLQFEDLGYNNLLKYHNIYTYEHKGVGADKFRIDHTFTNNESRVSMEYINMIEHGYDHKGMLISVK